MPAIPDLINLLNNPHDADVIDRVFGEPEPLNIEDGLLPHESEQPHLRLEIVCNNLAEIGSNALDAVPALVRCSQDEADSTACRFTKLAAVTAIWKITADPVMAIGLCERLLMDSECWFRRYVVELLEEIGHPALPALRERQVIDERYEVRERAARAIERIEGGLEREPNLRDPNQTIPIQLLFERTSSVLM